MRLELEDIFETALSGSVSGLCTKLDSSPMHTFELDGVAGSEDVLAKSLQVVSGDGRVTVLAPRVCIPSVFIHAFSIFLSQFFLKNSGQGTIIIRCEVVILL